MAAMMEDLIEGRMSPATGNAACNAGGKLLKVVELQHRYGLPGHGHKNKILDLTMNGGGNGPDGQGGPPLLP